jgi:hypothetical protein
MTDQCIEKVFPSGMNFPRAMQCSRAAKKDGFCLQHHPDAVAERRRKADERYKAQQEKSPWRRIERMAAVNQELIAVNKDLYAALETLWDACDGIRDQVPNHQAVMAAAESALAKARGEQ